CDHATTGSFVAPSFSPVDGAAARRGPRGGVLVAVGTEQPVAAAGVGGFQLGAGPRHVGDRAAGYPGDRALQRDRGDHVVRSPSPGGTTARGEVPDRQL